MHLRTDQTMGILLGEFQPSYEPEKSMEMMRKSPELAFDCLQQLVGRLFERGDLTRYE